MNGQTVAEEYCHNQFTHEGIERLKKEQPDLYQVWREVRQASSPHGATQNAGFHTQVTVVLRGMQHCESIPDSAIAPSGATCYTIVLMAVRLDLARFSKIKN